jgi:hypothetical protein
MRLEYGTALYSERQESGFIGIQPDRLGSGSSGPALEVAMPFGLLGRPLDPDLDPSGSVTVGANVLVLGDGDEGFTLPTGDPRFASLLPDVDKGGAGLYATISGGQGGSDLRVAYLLFAGDGSFTLNVPYAGGKAHVFTIDLGAGVMRLVHGEGPLVELSAAGVAIGGTGGQPVVTDQGLQAFLQAVSTALGALNQPVGPVPPLTATKATAV